MVYNKSQSTAIFHKDGPMLVLAGPGSGKTAVITQRTQNLIEEHTVNPGNILVITFTKAAANEMKYRFEKKCKAKVSFGTFHSVFFMMLKHAYHFTADNIIPEERRFQFMRNLVYKYQVDFQDESECISSLLAEISQIKNSGIELSNFFSTTCSAKVFHHIYTDYVNYLKSERFIDFDDMLLYTHELLKARKDILAAWQNKYQYIMIDEFQDINWIQYEIVKMLAAPRNNLFIVGDDDQSIYHFRGSKPEIMLGFTKDYPNAKQVVLDKNYRCSSAIVTAANQLIMRNQMRYPKETYATSLINEPVEFHKFKNQVEEHNYVLGDIATKVKKGAVYQDFAILVRTNHQPSSLMERMVSLGVPFQTKERIPSIYSHWIAKDLFTYFRIVKGGRNPRDFMQIMNKPLRYLSKESLSSVQKVDFAAWMNFYSLQPWMEERIEKLEYDIKMMEKMNPYAAINYLRHGVGYEEYLMEYASEKGMNKEDLLEVLDQIMEGARGFENVEKWQEHIKAYEEELNIQAKQGGKNHEAVTIATLHGAKGLEFKEVYIIDAIEGVMPYKKSVLPAEIEEERRLFYVGMTRAKEKLHLCTVEYYQKKAVDISRFIIEASTALKEKSKK